jgi:hypothetical protein
LDKFINVVSLFSDKHIRNYYLVKDRIFLLSKYYWINQISIKRDSFMGQSIIADISFSTSSDSLGLDGADD